MAEEVGIVMSLYDRVSPTLKAIAGNSKAFDKTLDELEQSLKAYSREQDTLVAKSAELKKAMGESALKVQEAQKSYKKLKDETSKGALDAAIDEQVRLKQQLTETEEAIKANNTAYRALYQSATETAAAMSKAENRAGTTSPAASRSEDTSGGILNTLGQAGAWSMLGDVAGQWADTLVTSYGGGEAGTLFSGALSGAGSGAAIGSLIAPGIGTAIGAGLGGLVGLASGGAQVYEQKDDAFQSYVQETTQGQMETLSASIASGSAIAAQRELDAIAFEQLLGEGVGTQYLSDLRSLAADTPMEYGDLTNMSRALATGFGDDTERMLDLMTAIGDAGSAVGVDASGMTYMAQVMSRMQSSGKVSLEDLNAFQDRGIDVIGMLGHGLGADQGAIYDMISKGTISGTKAVELIQQGLEQYAGAMDEMAKTFSGLESTLADAQTEMDNAYGEGYNETRKQGIQEEIDYLSGESGAIIQEANRAMGAWQAELENSKEQYIRDAMDAVIHSDAYQAAIDSGTEEGMAEAGRMLMAAKVQGMNEYNNSEGAQLMLEYEMSLASQIREDAATNEAYWDAGYRKGQEYSKGLAAAMMEVQVSGTETEIVAMDGKTYQYQPGYGYVPSSFAFGLTRVPYDNYPALLHQGERVLTAREARSADRAAGTVLNLTVTGNTFGGGMTAEEVAQAIANKMVQKLQAGYRG